MGTGLSDQEAIRSIREGHIDAYAVIVKKYTAGIQRYIRAKLYNKDEADDLVQNVFVSFYKAIFRFDEAKPVLPYLYQIAKNELKMYYRSRKETVRLDSVANIPLKYPEDNAADYGHLLHNLNSEQTIVFRMLQDGYSYQEIADKISRPINTVRTIIHRTRLQFKNQRHENS